MGMGVDNPSPPQRQDLELAVALPPPTASAGHPRQGYAAGLRIPSARSDHSFLEPGLALSDLLMPSFRKTRRICRFFSLSIGMKLLLLKVASPL